MPITSVELIGRRLNDTSISRNYYVHGPADEAEVIDVIRALPLKINGLPYREATAEEVDEIPGDWNFQVVWGIDSFATVEYRFNFTAPSAHIKQSLQTIRFCTIQGCSDTAASVGAPNFGGAINVVIDGGKKRVEGLDLGPPPEVFSLFYATDDDVVTPEYQLLVESMVGRVNFLTYRTRPPGSLLLTRCSGGKTGLKTWGIEFGWSYIANDISIPIGNGITVDAKDGHDLLWVFYGDTEDNDYHDVIPQPNAAYVERIWPRADFNELQLPE